MPAKRPSLSNAWQSSHFDPVLSEVCVRWLKRSGWSERA